MSVTIKTISAKPEGVLWWGQVSPANQAAIDAEKVWTSEQLGFISQETHFESLLIVSLTVTFDTVENYRAWRDERSESPTGLARTAYYTANGITTERIYL